MADFHFVQDHEKMIARLLGEMPHEQAMAAVVGGDYELVGRVEAAAVRHFGLRDGMTLIDFGCGSGRLASVLGQTMRIDYLGIDVVQPLLDFAKTRSPRTYRFVLHRALDIPAPDASADMISAFSVFTHLLHHETYIYLEDMRRVLRPRGRVVFSFLEFANPEHWPQFAGTVLAHRHDMLPHHNQFIERSVIDLWANKLGFEREAFLDGLASPWTDAPGLNHAIAVLRRP